MKRKILFFFLAFWFVGLVSAQAQGWRHGWNNPRLPEGGPPRRDLRERYQRESPVTETVSVSGSLI